MTDHNNDEDELANPSQIAGAGGSGSVTAANDAGAPSSPELPDQTAFWWIPITLASFLTFVSDNLWNTLWMLLLLAIVSIGISAYSRMKRAGSKQVSIAWIPPINPWLGATALVFSVIAAFILVHQSDVDTYFHDGTRLAMERGISGSERDVQGSMRVALALNGSSHLFYSPMGFIFFIIFSALYSWRSWKLIGRLSSRGSFRPSLVASHSRAAMRRPELSGSTVQNAHRKAQSPKWWMVAWAATSMAVLVAVLCLGLNSHHPNDETTSVPPPTPAPALPDPKFVSQESIVPQVPAPWIAVGSPQDIERVSYRLVEAKKGDKIFPANLNSWDQNSLLDIYGALKLGETKDFYGELGPRSCVLLAVNLGTMVGQAPNCALVVGHQRIQVIVVSDDATQKILLNSSAPIIITGELYGLYRNSIPVIRIRDENNQVMRSPPPANSPALATTKAEDGTLESRYQKIVSELAGGLDGAASPQPAIVELLSSPKDAQDWAFVKRLEDWAAQGECMASACVRELEIEQAKKRREAQRIFPASTKKSNADTSSTMQPSKIATIEDENHLADAVAQDIKNNGPEELRQLDLATIQSNAVFIIVKHRVGKITDDELARMGGVRSATEKSLSEVLANVRKANAQHQ